MITVFAWNEATKTGTWASTEDFSPPSDADVLWIDLENPTEDEEKLVFENYFPIHSLSLEDVQRPRCQPDQPPHFPKVEEFPDYLFVISNPLTPHGTCLLLKVDDGDASARINTQLSGILTQRILITHHYQPLVAISDLKKYLKKHPAQGSRGPDYLFHLILDVTVDLYAPMLDQLDNSLDHLEDKVFTNPGKEQLIQLLHLKRSIIQLRKTMVYEREVLARLSRGEFALIDARESVYYRNVYDHLIRFTELIEASREMVMDLMQTLLASQANKLSEVMKVLTMISVIILPMSLIAGVYGMNFEKDKSYWWPGLEHPYGVVIALAMMILAGVIPLAVFRWFKWF